MAEFYLSDLQATSRFGQMLARQLRDRPLPILLSGVLGSGKTALAAAIVSALPGGSEAEVASPSFTVSNVYPTAPRVVHCDLYRCADYPPEGILEELAAAGQLVILEWADRLPRGELPSDRLDITLRTQDSGRLLLLVPHGHQAVDVVRNLAERWQMDGNCQGDPHQ